MRLLGSALLSVLACSALHAQIQGEAAKLTDEVRAQARTHADSIVAEAKDSLAAMHALIVLGPVVWPVIEEVTKKPDLPEAARAQLGLLRALLVAKKEPDFEALRIRLRVAFASKAQDSIGNELLEFRLGRPDPKKPGKRLALAVKPKDAAGASVYRSADETIVVAFGADGNAKQPAAGDVTLAEPTAGFVAAVGGKSAPAPKKSGRGANVKVGAPLGFALGVAGDGAEGMKPGGAGGDGGEAQAKGGAGSHAHSGSGGAGAPG